MMLTIIHNRYTGSIRFEYSNADLRDANLSEAKLIDVDLSKANLRGADLSRAAFHKVYPQENK